MHLKGSLALLISLFPATAGLCQFKNTMLGQVDGGLPCAISISVNPRQPANIVAVSSPGDVFVTADGGSSWSNGRINSAPGVPGHSALITDDKGQFLYFHCSPATLGEGDESGKADRIAVQRSSDGGQTWVANETILTALPGHQQHPWAALDSKGNIYLTWTQMTADAACKSMIHFAMSKNGKKWTEPQVITEDAGDCEGAKAMAMPVVTFDGKVMIAWSAGNRVLLDRSFNGGDWWLSNDIVVSDQRTGLDLEIPGSGAARAIPVLATDISKSPYRGSLYIVWADQRNGADDTDIWFTRSHNYGDNWSLPTRLNNDGKGKHQYKPWITVDQSTGYIYVLYYDRRDYDDNQTDVYLAWSSDGGANFRNVRISESPFTPEDGKSTSLYNGLSVHKGVVAPVWSRVDNGVLSVWTAVIKHEDLEKKR